ncbi:DUF4328 domain-containing protein [Amycolatopsis mongoliensis]|uniref:DUF4328 domain-containing protein n=1 Tax=Amycolatopsis mongoliensis TaxID=715475 RepID=A0A9Y2NNB7_9PSEU|nr:DUF4328 domain-containing protein [Amycolatopsis sp. 4-36]WIY04290.1 DUF4328 domain-containing protein [Amycolatopsis sp. 4-36]
MHPGQPPIGSQYPPGYWPRQAPPPNAQQLQGRALAAQQEPYPYHRRPGYRPKLRWVATPPPGAWPRRRVVPPERYYGPPSYPVPPRWGFPNLVWRRPTSVPGTASDEVRPIDRMPVLSRSLIGVLFGFAVLSVVAAGAEIWRYVLLVQGRESALNRSVVAFSDGFVLTAGLLASVLALLPAGLSLWWLLVARRAAADVSGDDPPRPGWQVLVGILVPVANLPMALSIAGELEHAVLGRPRDVRPKPSRQVLVWWGAWVLNWVLLGVTIVWRFRDDVQSMADSVVLVALTDLAAATLAVVTALVVRRFTALLAPSDARAVRSMRVLKVAGAPEPELRNARPAGAAR